MLQSENMQPNHLAQGRPGAGKAALGSKQASGAPPPLGGAPPPPVSRCPGARAGLEARTHSLARPTLPAGRGALGDVTNRAKQPEAHPQPQGRRALGDISNKAARQGGGNTAAGLPKKECMHVCAPASPAAFDKSAHAPDQVASAACKHREPAFADAARSSSAAVPALALTQLTLTSPWAVGASPALPTFRGAAPSPFVGGRDEAPPPSPAMELDLTFAELAPDLSRLQLHTNESDEDMDMED